MQNRETMMQVIENTPAAKIPELELVKNRYIQNYNATHRNQMGDLMYQRQLIFFKQTIAGNEALQTCDPFSLYACIATAGVKGYSFDPADNEVYMIARGGKAYLDIQAGAHVRRLITTEQIKYAEQPVIVYEKDVFRTSKGRVLQHERTYETNNMIAAFIVMVLDEKGTERHFIYERPDWETWRAKSPMKNGPNWNTNGQPLPGFLRTKIVRHAATEKCWATGQMPANIEQYATVEIEAEEITEQAQPQATLNVKVTTDNNTTEMPQQQAHPVPVQDNDFSVPPTESATGTLNFTDQDDDWN